MKFFGVLSWHSALWQFKYGRFAACMLNIKYKKERLQQVITGARFNLLTEG
jgi:hypothetical protein